MEEVEAPKRSLVHWCYNKTFANRIRVDAERNSDQVRREKSWREPDWPGEYFLWNSTRLITPSTTVIGRSRRSQLPPYKLYDTCRLERGTCFLSVVSSCINNPLVAQHTC